MSHNMDVEHLTGLKTFSVTKLPTENTWQPTSEGDLTAICTHRIHERFRKEWFEILDTRPYVDNLILISNDHLEFIQLKKNLGYM
jgi:hypothetical protein